MAGRNLACWQLVLMSAAGPPPDGRSMFGSRPYYKNFRHNGSVHTELETFLLVYYAIEMSSWWSVIRAYEVGTSLAARRRSFGHLITQDVMIHCQKARYYAKDATLRRDEGHKDFYSLLANLKKQESSVNYEHISGAGHS